MNINHSTTPLTLVTKVILKNYRNYITCNSSLTQYNVLFGANGSGKTNFLEALSLLSPGKGLRNIQFETLLNKNDPCLRADITITGPLGVNTISVLNDFTYRGLSPSIEPPKKVMLIDGDPFKNIQQLLYIKPLWLTPKMDTLFLEDSRVQRNFFDRLIYNLDPSHLTRINAYNKALKERNALLKAHSNNIAWFNALEEILASHAVAIAASRTDFIDKMNKIIQSRSSKYFSNIQIETDGTLENMLHNDKLSALNCENAFRDKLKQSRIADYQTGSTSIGVHKSNFNILNLSNHLYCKNCSTGEQKIILITIIMAFTKWLISEFNTNILLLLDEILVHLDKNVAAALLEELFTLPVQVIITSTETESFVKFKDQLNFLEVQNNTIIPA